MLWLQQVMISLINLDLLVFAFSQFLAYLCSYRAKLLFIGAAKKATRHADILLFA
jgi:hypothetical protein